MYCQKYKRKTKNMLLEKIAENPKLLDELSMEELIILENIYDEELKKCKKRIK